MLSIKRIYREILIESKLERLASKKFKNVTPDQIKKISGMEDVTGGVKTWLLSVADKKPSDLERSTDIRLINDWVLGSKMRVTPVQLSFDLTIDQAVKKAEEWHDETFVVQDVEGRAGEVYMEAGNGWYWTQLKTVEDCTYEGEAMGQCVGDYGDDVESGNVLIFSLRSPDHKPFVTVGIENENIIEFKGRSNKSPVEKHLLRSIPFLKKSEQEGLWVELTDKSFFDNLTKDIARIVYKDLPFLFYPELKLVYGLPLEEDELMFNRDLNFLSDPNIEIIPDNVTFTGYLILSGSNIKEIGKNVKIEDSLSINNTHNITSLPNDIRIGNKLSAEGSNLESIPEGVYIGGDIKLEDSMIQSLPDKMDVRGYIYLDDTPISKLPSKFRVKDALNIWGCTNLKTLPDNLLALSINASESGLEDIPKNLRVRTLEIYNTPLSKKYTSKEIMQLIRDRGGSVETVR